MSGEIPPPPSEISVIFPQSLQIKNNCPRLSCIRTFEERQNGQTGII